MSTYLLGVGLVVLLVQLGVIALVLWISYRLVVSAIKTAIRESDEERAQRAQWSGGYSSDSTR